MLDLQVKKQFQFWFRLTTNTVLNGIADKLLMVMPVILFPVLQV